MPAKMLLNTSTMLRAVSASSPDRPLPPASAADSGSFETLNWYVAAQNDLAASSDELAARYRDQIASLRRVQERQYVSGAKGDVDVVAAWQQDGIGVVELIVIRNGQSLGSRYLRAWADLLETRMPTEERAHLETSAA